MNQLRKNFLCAVTCLFLFTQAIQAQEAAQAKKTKETASRTIEDGGTGAFKAVMVSDSSLSAFTIFRPKDMTLITDKTKLPIIAWGNGACANSPYEHLNFLSEVASQGYLVIAIGLMPQEGGQRGGAGMMGGGMPGGTMGGRGTRGAGAPAASADNANKKPQLIEAIDWAIAQDSNEASIYYKKLDTKKIAVAGMSCGGLQAYEAAPDARISTVMICNSGLFGEGGGGMGGMPNLPKSHLEKVHGSIIYILGGESDMAYPNGMDDFAKLEKIPAFASNKEGVGHGGTYMQPHGGDFAKVATAWLQWQLKSDSEAAKMFEGEPCGVAKMEGWTIQKKNIK